MLHQAGGTPRFGRRGARSRKCPPARSLSSHHLSGSTLRPIGLSKSDDQILNSVSDSPDDEDCLEDYVEGQQAEDLARDLVTLHISGDDEATQNNNYKSSPSPNLPHRRHRRVAQRGMSVDARMSGWCATENNDGNNNGDKKSKGPRSCSIMALHHPNVSSPRMYHINSALCSPQLQHLAATSHSYQGSNTSLLSTSSSPRFSHSSTSSPKAYHSSATPSPRLIHQKNTTPRSVISSPRLLHCNVSSLSQYSSPHHNISYKSHQSTSATIARVLQVPYDSNSAPSINTNGSNASKLSIDEPSTSGYSSNKTSASDRSTSRELERSEGLARMKPLELHTPPGTAPLPVKFIKKTPLADQSPSSWFSPPRQKDLTLPVKRTSQSRSSSSDASTSEEVSSKNRLKKCGVAKASSMQKCDLKRSYLRTTSAENASSCGSQNSLDSSMEVLVDTTSQRGGLPAGAGGGGGKTSSFSLDSMASGGSSMESLKSSMSEGSKSLADGGWRVMGSNTSLPLRPSLLLPAPHRSLIQVSNVS